MNLITSDEGNVCINQIIGHKKDSILIEEDFVVPDIKPDILNVISTSGNICIYKKEVMDGKVKIEGNISTYIIYLADDEQNPTRALNVNLDFSKIIEFPDIKFGMNLQSNCEIKQLETRVINGRKINVKAVLNAEFKAYSNENIKLIQDVENIEDIQVLKETINLNSLLGVQNTKIYAKDTIMIDDADDLVEIMKADFEIKNDDIKISYNKILLKADLETKILYLTEDGRINNKSARIPIMGFIDMQDIQDDNICDLQYEIKNIIIKPNSVEEHSIYVEVEIEIICSAYKKIQIDVIQDLYSLSIDLQYNQREIKGISNKKMYMGTFSVRQKQRIPEIENCKINDISVKPKILTETVSQNKILYQGEMELSLIYSSNDMSRLSNKTLIIPFEYSIDCDEINSNYVHETKMEVLNENFMILSEGELNIELDINFIVKTYKQEIINYIEEIDTKELKEEMKSSLVIYYVKPGDTLWKIAKKFRTSVEAIKELNDIEDERNLKIGSKLYIPKFVRNKIS